MKIVLDTNFLLIPAQFNVDIFSEIERICDFSHQVCILEQSLDELNKIIVQQTGKNKAAAKLALQLVKQKGLNTIRISKKDSVDNILANLPEMEYMVATQDIELKRRLKAKNIKIITLRNKKYLNFE
jgi:uncharacterized protein